MFYDTLKRLTYKQSDLQETVRLIVADVRLIKLISLEIN